MRELWKHQKYAIEKYKDKPFFGLLFDMGLGKEQPLSSKVLTPDGYLPMSKIKVGITVLDGAGKPCKVTGVFPQGYKKVYKINFSDNTYIRVGEEHLNQFELHNGYNQGEVTITTKELINGLAKGLKYWCLLPTCELKCNMPLLIDPYLLGVLIGDGRLGLRRSLFVTLAEEDVKLKVERKLNAIGCELVHKDKFDYYITSSAKLREQLDILMLRCNSTDKHIPYEYLFSSVEDRIQLLQGLFDTDGTVQINKKRKSDGHAQGGGCSFSYSTVSKHLSDDFAFLVRSLGLVDRVSEREAKYRVNGITKITGTDYRHFLKVPNGFTIASSKKHLSKITDRQLDSPMRKVISVVEDGFEECQCIMVDSPLHTYITDNVTVTHNTLTATRIAEEKDVPVLIIAPNVLCKQWEAELTDKGENRITTKDWNVVLCTSKTKNTKKFNKALDELCKD